MTPSLAAEVAELARLTRAHLIAVHQPEDILLAVPEAFHYFKSSTLSVDHQHLVQPSVAVVKREQAPMPQPIRPQPSPPPAVQTPPPPPVRRALTPPPVPTEQPAKKQEATPLQGFSLDPLAKPTPLDLNDIKAIYTQRFPHQSILEHPLDDSAAQKSPSREPQKNVYPQVGLLLFSTNPKLMTFMHNVARAIHQRWGLRTEILPAQQWEQEQAWDGLLANSDLRLLLASDYGLQSLPNLMKNYREASKQSHHFLGNKPLLLLSDLTLYLREPHLKQSLWHAIHRIIGK